MSKTNPKMKTSRFLALAAIASIGIAHADLPDQLPDRHMGVATCAASQCHGSAAARDGSNVLQNEYVTWTRDDPHSGAYASLATADSRAIAARLGLADATRADLCLDCHADNVAPERRGEKFQISDGVGCEACHGGAERWLSTHYNTSSVDHAANLAAGLYPTEDPQARATLCLSCHLGTEDKFATHQIMAAGHPRLAFELDTFTELWTHAGRQPHYRVDDDYVQRKGADDHVYVWATGVIAEARLRLRLIRNELQTSTSLFPELAHYDCHACHRSMQSVEWRRLPRHGDAGPGAPFLNDGALVMTLALARAVDAGVATDVASALQNLHAAAGGDRTEFIESIGDMDLALSNLQSQTTAQSLRSRERRVLREMLEAGAEGNFLDYASAEQAFMAVQMLVLELGDSQLEEKLTPLGDALDDDERYEPAVFAQLLSALND